MFAELAPHLALGVSRIPMGRHIGLGDIAAARAVAAAIARMSPDVVHGHGAKGAAYARLAGRRAMRSASIRRMAAACFTGPARAERVYFTLEKS